MSAPAGWYPQPDGQQRYWDGELWTENFAPGVSPAKSQVAPRRNWFLRHKILTAIGALLLLAMFSGFADGGSTKSVTIATVADSVATSATPDQAAADQAAADQAAADQAAADQAAADQVAADQAAADQVAADQAAAAKAMEAAKAKAATAAKAKAAAAQAAAAQAAAAEVAAAEVAAAEAAAAAAAPAESVYYENCTAARAAGAAPIMRGEPGYASKLDRDNDGIACE